MVSLVSVNHTSLTTLIVFFQWAIIYPFACLTLLAVLFLARRRAVRTTHFKSMCVALPCHPRGGTERLTRTRLQQPSLEGGRFREHSFLGTRHRRSLPRESPATFFILSGLTVPPHQLVASLTLILVPFTLAGGVSKSWGTAKIIVMLVLGLLLAPVFVWWEAKKARHPILPFELLKNRTVVACLVIACMLNFSWPMQGTYLYTVLVVSFGESTKSATRIATLYSFTSAITGLVVGFVVRYVRVLKPFMIAVRPVPPPFIQIFADPSARLTSQGVMVYILAFGLLIRYRGGPSDYGGIIAGEVVLGLAGGLFPYAAQVTIQACSSHESQSTPASLARQSSSS